MADQVLEPIPNLLLPQHLFTLSSANLADRHPHAREELLKAIESDREPRFVLLVSPPYALGRDGPILRVDNFSFLISSDPRLDLS